MLKPNFLHQKHFKKEIQNVYSFQNIYTFQANKNTNEIRKILKTKKKSKLLFNFIEKKSSILVFYFAIFCISVLHEYFYILFIFYLLNKFLLTLLQRYCLLICLYLMNEEI